jgi:hypothetical protein
MDRKKLRGKIQHYTGRVVFRPPFPFRLFPFRLSPAVTVDGLQRNKKKTGNLAVSGVL